MLGLAELSQRGGGGDLVPGLAELLARLDASGCGSTVAILGAVGSPPTGGSGSDASWLTVDEAAELMCVTTRTARSLASRGQVVGRKDRRGWLLDRRGAEDYRRMHVG